VLVVRGVMRVNHWGLHRLENNNKRQYMLGYIGPRN
jgi:hypothetical protein